MKALTLVLRTGIVLMLDGVSLGLAQTRTSMPPNILIAVADDWGFGHAGVYGCKWARTPAFDRIANQGILFTRAYTPNAKCAPSRACILTGRNPWQLGAAANHVPFFPAEFKTYSEALAENGWWVGLTGKGWAPGVATNTLGKLRQMVGRPFDARTAPPPPTTGIAVNDYAANFADFLAAAPRGKPWCFWYGAFEPHRDYEHGSGVAKGGKKLSEIDTVPGCWPDNEVVRNDLLDYAFEVEHFDRHLGKMLAELERRGLLENTLVIVTSDNGLPFPRAKGCQYEAGHHLPLAMMWPRGLPQAGRVASDLVSLIDLAPTLIELAGLHWEQTGMAAPAGRSLAGILFAKKSGRVNPSRNQVLVGRERNDVGRPRDEGYPIRGLVTDDNLYLLNFATNRWPAGNPETGYLDCDGSPTKTEILNAHRKDPGDLHWALCFGRRPAEELYDLKADPDCLHNLAGQPDRVELKKRLQQQLLDQLRAQEDPRVLGQGRVFDQYPYAEAAHRHFYERFMAGENVPAGWVNDSDFERAPIRE